MKNWAELIGSGLGPGWQRANLGWGWGCPHLFPWEVVEGSNVWAIKDGDLRMRRYAIGPRLPDYAMVGRQMGIGYLGAGMPRRHRPLIPSWSWPSHSHLYVGSSVSQLLHYFFPYHLSTTVRVHIYLFIVYLYLPERKIDRSLVLFFAFSPEPKVVLGKH